MKKKLLRNERGDLSFFSIFVILAVNMLLSFLLLFASVKINWSNIRNAAKMELNNVSARIYADTFHSQREANLKQNSPHHHLHLQINLPKTPDRYMIRSLDGSILEALIKTP